ncbi:hypothetical protein SOCE26_010910 [Sorangium cellulosum]|uniref:Fis family transcriptional regulator n=1 Tax=Sorangium cellulosum TaxID=56 RepID=A0A2L0EK65_SORCE|nr:sigma 54-interacting transcriptional regulator [Sorangium cellulosum]AUX39696.1 hypothetical protein SOCE26_010910 [Sorangium cellulosum]
MAELHPTAGPTETAPLSTTMTEQIALERSPRRSAVLLVYHHDGVEAAPLSPGVAVVVGREPPADVAIPDPCLSRRHARFTWVAADEIAVEDLGSANGTRVAGKRVQQASVRPGDEVQLGGMRATVHVTSGADAAALGVEGHDAVRTAIQAEMKRARFFGGRFAVLVVRAALRSKGHIARWCPRVCALLRPVDRIARYSEESVEILLPEAGEDQALSVARALVEPRPDEPALVCGVAPYPGAATSADELISLAWDAAGRAGPARRIEVARGEGARVVAPRADAELTSEDSRLVAESAAMRNAVEVVTRVAHARSAPVVLLQGESGVGKEVLAQLLHDASPRRQKPLVCVNCGAIPAGLVEGILFGSERGVYTSAYEQRRGVFEQANGGTLFLDEIGDLPMQAQTTLLRVLETKRVSRLGSTKELPIDIQIVAATHCDLEAMVAAKTFRNDLYWRLNTMAVEIPPLRARREEIVPLARRFLTLAAKANERAMRGFDEEALSLLERYSWPGNVRELKHAIDHAVVLAEGDMVTARDLPPRVRGAGRSPLDAGAGAPRSGGTLKERLRRAEIEAIVDALREVGGSQTEAARLLDLPLRTLQDKIKKLGITRTFSGPAETESGR